MLGARLVGDRDRDLVQPLGVPHRRQADRLREHRRDAGARDAVQPLVPPVVGGDAQALDRRRLVQHLRGLLGRRSAARPDRRRAPRCGRSGFWKGKSNAMASPLSPLPAVDGAVELARRRQVGGVVRDTSPPAPRRCRRPAPAPRPGAARPPRTCTRAGRRGRSRRCGACTPGCRSCGRTDRSAAPPPCRPATDRSRRASRCARCSSSARCAMRAQVRDAARVHDRRPDVVDQLLADQLLAVVNRREHLAHRQRRRRVLPDQAEALLQLGRDRVLHPEQVIRLQLLAQPRRLDRRQPVVDVVQQVEVGPELAPRALEQRAARRSGTAPSKNASPAACPSRPARSAACRARRRTRSGRRGRRTAGAPPCSRGARTRPPPRPCRRSVSPLAWP